MKQTAVEWLVQELTLFETPKWVQEAVDQSKEMEKEQIINSYRDGRSDQQSDISSKFYNRMAEQYYNETLKSE